MTPPPGNPPPPRRGRWAGRCAGGALGLLGLANLGFGVAGFVLPALGLSPTASGGLAVGGVALLALGVLVWRGSWPLTLLALTVVGALFLVEVASLASGQPDDDEVVPRLLVSGGLTALLALAAVRRKASHR